MGGIAIAGATTAAFIAGIAVSAPLPSIGVWVAVPLAALAMFVVGLLDDRLQLSPLAKLVSSLIIGAFLVFALTQTEPAGLPWGQTLAATIWFAGVCHTMNLIDNMDGLAAGVGLIAAAFLAWLAATALGPALVLLLVALAGGQLGFLYWNRSRARLFMGDCGSLFIGATLAGCTLALVFSSAGTSAGTFVRPMVIALLVLVVPLFDTAFVLALRRLAGRAATRGGTDHVSHRLVSLGFSDRSAVRILYLLGLLGGLVAWAITAGPIDVIAAVAPFAVLVALLGIYLARVPAYNAEDFLALQKSSFAPFLKDLTFRWHAFQVLLDVVLIAACYYGAYRLRFEGEELETFLPSFTASLPMVLGLKLAALYASGLYRRSWETFGLRDIASVLRGVAMGSVLSVLASVYLYRFERFSRNVFIFDAFLLTLAILATRASFRTMTMVASSRSKRSRRVLVYGAGGFGQLLVREMRVNPDWQMNPVAFIDDDPIKIHRWIAGVPVRGALEQLEASMRRYAIDEVVLSSPAINGQVERRIKEICNALDRPVRRLHMEIR